MSWFEGRVNLCTSLKCSLSVEGDGEKGYNEIPLRSLQQERCVYDNPVPRH